jgi:hypothetical protein
MHSRTYACQSQKCWFDVTCGGEAEGWPWPRRTLWTLLLCALGDACGGLGLQALFYALHLPFRLLVTLAQVAQTCSLVRRGALRVALELGDLQHERLALGGARLLGGERPSDLRVAFLRDVQRIADEAVERGGDEVLSVVRGVRDSFSHRLRMQRQNAYAHACQQGHTAPRAHTLCGSCQQSPRRAGRDAVTRGRTQWGELLWRTPLNSPLSLSHACTLT